MLLRALNRRCSPFQLNTLPQWLRLIADRAKSPLIIVNVMLVLSANQKPRRAAAPSGVAEYFQDDGLGRGYEDCVAEMSTRRHPQNHNHPVRPR
jgi:hypothetical protein